MKELSPAPIAHSSPPQAPGEPGLWHHLLDEIPVLDPAFWDNRHDLEIRETAFVLAQAFLGSQIPDAALEEMVRRAFSTEALLLDLAPGDLILELFDGPSGSYCDFGARFAAELLGWRYRENPGGFRVVAALPAPQRAAALAALAPLPCRALFLEPRRATDEREARPPTAPARWTLARGGEDFPACERLAETLLDAPAAAPRPHPLAALREDSFPWVLGLAIALLHGANQLPQGVKPAFVLPASCPGLLAAVKLLERLGLPIEEVIQAATERDHLTEISHLSEGEAAAAIRELKALYNYDCDLDGAAAWRTAQIWRGPRLGVATVAAIPFAPGPRNPQPNLCEVDLSPGESAAWLQNWAELKDALTE